MKNVDMNKMAMQTAAYFQLSMNHRKQRNLMQVVRSLFKTDGIGTLAIPMRATASPQCSRAETSWRRRQQTSQSYEAFYHQCVLKP